MATEARAKRVAAVARRDRGRPRGAPVVAAVLDETMRALAREGIAGVRVEAVAAAAGVNKTSVYRRWPTREALVGAALARATERLSTPPETGTLEGDLQAIVRGVGAFLASDAGRATLAASLGGLDASGAVPRGALEARAQEAARAMFAAAAARGERVRAGDAEATVFALVGAVLHRVLLERRAVTRAWAAATVRRALYGVVGAPSRRR